MAQNAINNTIVNANFTVPNGTITAGTGLTVTTGPTTINSGASAINIGTDGTAKTISIGNMVGATAVNTAIGTGGFLLDSSSGTIITAQDTGEINHPLQPAFCAYQNTNVDNVTGDGTSYVPAAFNTELFDQGGNFASNTFTAPVTGRYLFTFSLYLGSIGAGHTTMSASLMTTDNTFRMIQVNPAAIATGTFEQISASVIAPLDLGDTAVVQVVVSGSTLTVDWSASGSPPRALFSGCLLA